MLQALRFYVGKQVRFALWVLASWCLFAGSLNAETRPLSQLFDNAPSTEDERYAPGVWIDPDGCEHWVMDDGFEGFMTPHIGRDGVPVCRTQSLCGLVKSDQFFTANTARLGPGAKSRLAEFFSATQAVRFAIIAHTDDRGDARYNLRLSEQQARAVADVATEAGVLLASVRGLGANAPKQSNTTASGMAANRRVEIICLR